MGFLLPQTAFDDLDVHLFNSRVTDHAGLSDVFAVDARPLVGVFEDVVRRVARSTDRGHGQTLFKKALAVDRH